MRGKRALMTISLAVIVIAWLAATACGLMSCRAQFRRWPSVQAWNAVTALAYMAVALIAVAESDWFAAGLAAGLAVLRWKHWRRDAGWSG